MYADTQTCYKHPDQQAGVICQRCDRPICPKCMHQASVGFHCPECTKQGAQQVYQGIPAIRTKPVLTMVLIGINVAVFVLGIVISGPDSIMDGSNRMIRDFGLAAPPIYQGEYYRLITSGFLHGGLLHIALNMWVLWLLGQAMEIMGKRSEYAAVYLASLLAGGLGALVIDPDLLTVGASGAIFGLAGAIIMAQRSRGIPFRQSGLFWFVVINAVISVSLPGISWGGHLGGFIGGAITGWAFYDLGRRPSTKPWVPWVVTGVTCVVLALLCVNVSTTWVHDQLFLVTN